MTTLGSYHVQLFVRYTKKAYILHVDWEPFPGLTGLLEVAAEAPPPCNLEDAPKICKPKKKPGFLASDSVSIGQRQHVGRSAVKWQFASSQKVVKETLHRCLHVCRRGFSKVCMQRHEDLLFSFYHLIWHFIQIARVTETRESRLIYTDEMFPCL